MPRQGQTCRIVRRYCPKTNGHSPTPYRELLAANEAVIEAALARTSARPKTAAPAVAAHTIIEHRRTGERRVYAVSPIRS